MRRIIGVLLVAACASGCSQAAQLRPVAGGAVSAVRTATNDVLVASEIPIETAPTCAYEEPLFVCRGTAAGGVEIVAESKELAPYGATKDEWGAYVPADMTLQITVGGEPLFDGKVEDVLQSNGRVTQ